MAPTTPTKAKNNPLTTVFSAPEELDPELDPEEEEVVVGAAEVVVAALEVALEVGVDEEPGVFESNGAGGTLAVPLTEVTVSAAMTDEA